MPDKKCPLCDGTCILKVMMSKDAKTREVDVCSLCGATYPKDKDAGDGGEEEK
jgi:uncharacterized protein YbaR (Trm112 family)